MSHYHGYIHHSPASHRAHTVHMRPQYQPPPALEGRHQPEHQPGMASQVASTSIATPEMSYIHHIQGPIIEPTPTHRIDMRHLEYASDSPEFSHMQVLRTPQLQYQGQPQAWVQVTEPQYVSYDAIQPSHDTYIEYDYTHGVAPPFCATPVAHAPAYELPYAPYPSHSSQQYAPCSPQYHQPSQYSSSCASSSTYYSQPAPPSSYVPFTPAPSNPSSGTSTPQEEYTKYPENRHHGSDPLVHPVTPSCRPAVPWLLLGQTSIVQPSAPHLSHQEYDTSHSGSAPVVPSHAVSLSQPSAYDAPPSPVSPTIEPYQNSPTTVAPEMTTAPPSSRQVALPTAEPIAVDSSPIISVVTDTTLSQAEERLRKLRDRRHVVACTFCRGRKIACHSSSGSDKADSTSEGKDEEYRPAIKGTKRASTTNKPPCDNCVRRGRECVYPPRAPRSNRRRRRETREASPLSPDYEDSSQ